MKVLFALFVAFILLATFSPAAGRSLRQQGKVQIYHEANVSGVRIKFVDLIEDSRCPIDTQCIWAGNAKLKVQLSKNGRSKIVEMNTGTAPRTIRFEGYEVKVTKLTPQPASNIRIRKDGYVATFSVVRKR